MRLFVGCALILALTLVGCHLHSPATPTVGPTVSSTPQVPDTPTAIPTETPVPPTIIASPTVAPPSETPTAVVSLASQTIPTPPPRDLVDLRKRLGETSGSPPATPAATSDAVGSRLTFWVADQTTRNYFQMPAVVVYRTAHTVWYIQDGVNVPNGDVATAAGYFESKTYPTEHQLFGSEEKPGTPNLITILVGHIPGVGGYFSSADEYPRYVNPYSNQRKMIYINVDSVQPGSAVFNHTVAHECMHMIQFNIHPDQNSWINEGSAELAALAVTGIPSATIGSFERAPETQLNAWASEPSDAIPHYGGAYLFMLYVSEHFGGYGAIGRAVADPSRGMTAFSSVFQSAKPPLSFDDVFANWVAANVVNNSQADGGLYGYQGLKLNPTVHDGPRMGQSVNGQAVQFGTAYYRIKVDQPATLVFRGAPSVQRIGADPNGSPYEWWSNRGDSIDSRLTRTVDLRAVTHATLHFMAWYDIEDGYDYAYVETSADGGQTWKTMPASTTTTANPSGQNYGNGFTGESGGKPAQWVSEQVDLNSVAGKEVLLRFEYVTDDSYNGDGLALDGFSIPEIGWFDSAATDEGWLSNGFVRIDNRETQPYLIEVIDPSKPTIHRIPVDAKGSGTARLSSGASYIVAVDGLAPLTTHQSGYSLSIQRQ